MTCQFVIGDGLPTQFASGTGIGATRKIEHIANRDPGFSITLQPVESVPTSFCTSERTELDQQKRIVLEDVHPGKYRVRISDLWGAYSDDDILFEETFAATGHGTVLTVPLGAGSITGALEWSGENRYVIHVIAVGKNTGTIRHAHCDPQGNFCACYLPPDDYVIYAHDYDAGWCETPSISVNNQIVDVGPHQLRGGGTISGMLPAHLAADSTVTIEAVDPKGIRIEYPNFREPIGSTFAISNLWPARWNVRVKRGQKVLAEKTVVLEGTETVTCDWTKL